ncbi:uncharacterized protein LOC119085550 [Bradysia coprophila]|uniref:uncharacterized protein LOC119085550 n=1 Tax=Bradysia coprophila TaxID=38358 RepID=UPI00187D8472|nr:uncharacterized protein LOC119085550 [Bradysia coprophila]
MCCEVMHSVIMEMQGGRAFFLVVFASQCYVSACAKNLIVIIPNTEICKVLDHTFVQSYTCRSKNVNRTLNLSSKEIIFKPGVTLTNYHAHVTLYRKFATVYRQFMVDVHYDSCAFRAGKKSTVTQVISFDGRLKYGNFWEPCPLSGRRYEHNVPMGKFAVDIFPSGEYRFDTRSYTIVNGEKKYLMLTQSYGEVKYTTIEHWKKK